MATETIPNGINSAELEMVSITKLAFDRMESLLKNADIASQKVFEIITLIHAAADLQNRQGSAITDRENMTDRDCRFTSLMLMLQDKSVEVIRLLD